MQHLLAGCGNLCCHISIGNIFWYVWGVAPSYVAKAPVTVCPFDLFVAIVPLNWGNFITAAQLCADIVHC
jgi:hypothetical protein